MPTHMRNMQIEQMDISLLCDIDKALVPHHPSTAILKGWLGNMSKQNQGWCFHNFFHNCLHNLVIYEPFFFICIMHM